MWPALIEWLWPFHPRPRVVARLNTVDLSGDLDDVELLMGAEDRFGIKISDSEAQSLFTVGQLCDVVVAKSSLEAKDVWPRVVQITRDHSGCAAPIDRETTFFARYATPRRS